MRRTTNPLKSGACLAAMTPGSSTWAEALLATDRPDFSESMSTVTFYTGLTHLLNPDLQADMRVLRRLTDRGVDFLVGAGISWRLGR